jgi:hypothetical protein
MVWRVQLELEKFGESLWVNHYFKTEAAARKFFASSGGIEASDGWRVREVSLTKIEGGN